MFRFKVITSFLGIRCGLRSQKNQSWTMRYMLFWWWSCVGRWCSRCSKLCRHFGCSVFVFLVCY